MSVSVAYSGRIAVAYKNGKSFKGKSVKDSKNREVDTRYFDLVVAIYECESTGGKTHLFGLLIENFEASSLVSQLTHSFVGKVLSGFKKM